MAVDDFGGKVLGKPITIISGDHQLKADVGAGLARRWYDTEQGLLLTTSFYWDMDDKTREWSKRYFAKMNRMPTMWQAGVYSSVMSYLNAIKEICAISAASGAMNRAPPGLAAMLLNPGQPMPAPHSAAALPESSRTAAPATRAMFMLRPSGGSTPQ